MQLHRAADISCLQDPFPHAVADPFLAPSSYDALMESLPDFSFYDRDPYHPEGLRYGCWPYLKRKKFDTNTAQFWSEAQEFFAAPETVAALFKPFASVFAEDATLQAYLKEGTPMPALRLVQETCPFTIAPHLDMQMKILVVLLYLDRSGVPQNGTSLYVKDVDTFLPVKTTEYKSNTALITPRIKHSWHGGSWSGTGTRNTLHIYYFPQSFFARSPSFEAMH